MHDKILFRRKAADFVPPADFLLGKKISVADCFRFSLFQICLLYTSISTPFCAALIQGISETLLSSNYMPLFVSCNNSIKEEESYIRSLMSRHVDGLIVNTCSSQNPLLIQQACTGLPIVLCDRTIDDYNFQFVGSNHRDPIFELVKHLKEQGYTDVYKRQDFFWLKKLF